MLLERFPALASLSPQSLDELVAGSAIREVPAGAVLFEPGERCEGFPLVLEGSVRVATTSAGGREIVLYRVGPGEGCVLSGGCLLGQGGYRARGIADTDVRLLSIPPARFDDLMVRAPAFRSFVFEMYGARLAEVMELVEEVAFHKLDTRLALFLVRRGPVIDATHQSIADELGSVRVFVSRLLRSFELRGWIRLARERVTVVDPKALLEFARQ